MNLLRWQIDANPETTRDCYARINVVEVDSCICTGCENFRVLRNEDFPPEFNHLLAQLGVARSKPAEITNYGPDKSPLHIYHVFYHFAGRLLQGRDGWKEIAPNSWTADFESLGKDVKIGLTTRLSLVPEPFRAFPTIQLECDLRLPWVVEEPPG